MPRSHLAPRAFQEREPGLLEKSSLGGTLCPVDCWELSSGMKQAWRAEGQSPTSQKGVPFTFLGKSSV